MLTDLSDVIQGTTPLLMTNRPAASELGRTRFDTVTHLSGGVGARPNGRYLFWSTSCSEVRSGEKSNKTVARSQIVSPVAIRESHNSA